jgi:hypothetical protein
MVSCGEIRYSLFDGLRLQSLTAKGSKSGRGFSSREGSGAFPGVEKGVGKVFLEGEGPSGAGRWTCSEKVDLTAGLPLEVELPVGL